MKYIEGFIVNNSLIRNTDYLFNKLKVESYQNKNTSINNYLAKYKSQEKYFYVSELDKTYICLTNVVEYDLLKTLSIFGLVCVFKIDVSNKKMLYTIFDLGESKGNHRQNIETGKNKSFFNIFRKNKDEQLILEKAMSFIFDELEFKTSSKDFPDEIVFKNLIEHQISPIKTTYVDPFSKSNNATPFSVNMDKVLKLMPSSIGMDMPYKTDFDGSPMTEQKFAQRIKETIQSGVVSPAYLIQHDPLCVSVYSFDMDAVIFLKFEDETFVAEQFKKLKPWTKLIAVNIYLLQAQSGLTNGVEVDIIPGPKSTKTFKSFAPIIVNFVADDDDWPLLKYWENKFTEDNWRRVKELTIQYSRRFPGEARFGNFMLARLVTTDFSDKFYPYPNANN